MWRFPKKHLLIAGARWGAGAFALFSIWRTGALAQLERDAQPLLWIGYITLYTLLWTWHLPRFISRAREGSIVVLYDLLLTALPVWFSGGWTSPFWPYLLSALIVPAAIQGWSGGLLVAAAALAVDQLILWTTTYNPWEIATSGQSLALVGRTLLPFGVTAAVVMGVDIGQRWQQVQRRRERRATSSVRWEYPPAPPLRDGPRDETALPYDRLPNPEPSLARPWSKERASQPTLERRSPITIQATLRQVMPDFQAARIAVVTQVEGDERQLSEQLRELLIKAVEIGLDNVLCHAHAQSVKVVLEIKADAVVLNVSDDGIGLFDGTAEPPGFHQVKRLRYRVQELGGTLRVAERDEGGVELYLRLPLVG